MAFDHGDGWNQARAAPASRTPSGTGQLVLGPLAGGRGRELGRQRGDIGPVGEDDMTAVRQPLGDPGLERPARAGRSDVPTGLARGSGLGNSHRSSAGVCLRPS
jgi:hypothetical protein